MTPVAAIVALSCWAPPPAPAPDLDRIVSVLRGEAVPPPPSRSDVAARHPRRPETPPVTVTLSAWCLPLAVTFVLAAWAVLMPMPRPQGAYDFGGLLSVCFRAAAVVVGSLVAWLIWALVR